jgi:hypothetical protein
MKMLVRDGPFSTESYARLYAEIVDRELVIYIPFFPEGVARKPELNPSD